MTKKVLADWLRTLLDTHGRITPEVVVEAAQPVDSPAHDEFDWDDKIAGHKHRIAQARMLIRSVRIRWTVNKVELRVPAYIRDPDAEAHEQGYVSIPSLTTDEDRKLRALAEEIRRADACLSRAYRIAQALGMGEQFDAIRAELAGILHRATG